MRKSTNLQTPQFNYRRSDYGGASSGGSANFRMSIGQGRLSILDSVRRSSTASNRDRRVATDKNSHLANYTNMTSFLMETGFVLTNTIRLQAASSTREVVNIVEHLLSQADLNVNFKKFDEDFPVLMKTLCYPYTINKRQLQPVTSHNWPVIVHGLSWLTNAAKYLRKLKEHPAVTIPDVPEKMAKLAILKMNTESFKLFTAGEDDDRIKARDEEFLTTELSHFEGFGGDEATKMIELEEKLKAEMDELEKLNDDERKLDTQLLTMQSDAEKLQTYLDDSSGFIETMTSSLATFDDKKENLVKSIESLEQELKEKKSTVANQKYSVYDIQQKRAQISHLQTICSSNKSNFDVQMKEMVDVEMEVLNKKEKLNSEIEEYSRLATGCKLIPQTAENAKGYDYSIYLQNPESDVSPSNIHDLHGRLKLILKQLKEANQDSSVKLMKEIETKQQYQSLLTTTQNSIIDVNSKVKRLEEDLMSNEQNFKKENQKLVQELVVLEEKIAELKSVATSRNVEALEAKVKELHLKNKNMKEAMEKRVREVKDNLLDIMEEFLQSKSRVENMTKAATAEVKQWSDDMYYNGDSTFNKNKIKLEELTGKLASLQKEVEATTKELHSFGINI